MWATIKVIFEHCHFYMCNNCGCTLCHPKVTRKLQQEVCGTNKNNKPTILSLSVTQET
jgi:hypothetical protein